MIILRKRKVMYYRRKILLAMLQQFGGSMSKFDLQNLLFLFCRNQGKTDFDFIPGEYGSLSCQANQDLKTLSKYGIVKDSENIWSLNQDESFIDALKTEDKTELTIFHKQYKNLKGNDLIKYVYEKDPYYAINSDIAASILDEKHYEAVLALKPDINNYTLFTIGYEGKTVEYYVNQLIRYDIKVLCDVRKNPLSMKYGFSKSQLKKIVESVGIKYMHFPELGVESEKRKKLETKEDFQKLFDEFELEILSERKDELNNINKMFYRFGRIALTCFEADNSCCHRSRIAKVLSNKFNNQYTVKHL